MSPARTRTDCISFRVAERFLRRKKRHNFRINRTKKLRSHSTLRTVSNPLTFTPFQARTALSRSLKIRRELSTF